MIRGMTEVAACAFGANSVRETALEGRLDVAVAGRAEIDFICGEQRCDARRMWRVAGQAFAIDCWWMGRCFISRWAFVAIQAG